MRQTRCLETSRAALTPCIYATQHGAVVACQHAACHAPDVLQKSGCQPLSTRNSATPSPHPSRAARALVSLTAPPSCPFRARYGQGAPVGWAPKGENKPATGNDDATKSTAGSEAYMIPCAPCAVFRHARGSRETPRRPGKRVRSQRRAAAPARFAGRLHAGAPLEGSGQLAPAWTPCSITAPCATPPSPRPAAAARRSRERAARRTTPRRMAFWHRGVPRVECGV